MGEIRQIGRFKILRALGAGGQGMVYLAEDSQLERQVAIKRLRVRTAAHSEALQHEARIVSKVQGCSEHLGVEQHQSIRDELTDFSGKIRIELIAPDEIVPQILQIIHSNAYAGQKGDGILWVTEVVDFYRLCKPMN